MKRSIGKALTEKTVGKFYLEKQFNIKLSSKKTGIKKFSSFRKSQNHLKNLLGLFLPESPSCINIENQQSTNPKDFQIFLTLLSNVLRL